MNGQFDHVYGLDSNLPSGLVIGQNVALNEGQLEPNSNQNLWATFIITTSPE